MSLPIVFRVAAPSARRQVAPFTGAAGLGLLGVALDLARPWPLALTVDHALGGQSQGGLSPNATIALAAAAIVVLTALLGLVDMGAAVAAERAAERVGARLRQDVFDHALSLSLRWHDRTRSGELITRLTTDVGRVLDALVSMSTTLLPALLRLGIVLVVLVVLDAELALVALAVVPLLAAFAVRQRRRVRSVQQAARTESGRLAAAATDLLRNVRAVQAFAHAQRTSGAFGTRNQVLLAANLRAVTTEARWAPLADAILAVGSGLVLVVGGREVLGGRLSTGDLLVVMSYLSALYAPVRGLARLSALMARSSVSAARIDDVLHCAERLPDRPDPLPAPAVVREVRFDAVHFAYEPGRPVLDGFELTVPAGQTVALLGRSGCGKSTILSLLLRLYDVSAGSIRIDGVDVRDIAQTSLRRRIAFVPQDAWLFDATIAANIAYGSPHATRHGVLDAARSALVDEFVARLPDGYDTVVGEHGNQLSGGQRRRIALARAAVSDAPLVLLDEPTASLDAASADAIMRAIRRSTAGRTVLLVTHDTDLAAMAHRTVLLDRGLDAPRAHLPGDKTREEVRT